MATDERIRELSRAFAPCTLEGLADRWSALNKEIARIRKERDAIETILAEHSAAHHNGADEPWREGTVIQGKEAAVRARWRMVRDWPPKWGPKLEEIDDNRHGHH